MPGFPLLSLHSRWSGRLTPGQPFVTAATLEHTGSFNMSPTGEVAWILPECRKTYWRGTVTSLRHEWSA